MKEVDFWDIGQLGKNCFKVSVLHDDKFETLRFHIENDGEFMQIDMHTMYCEQLSKEIDKFIEICKELKE